MRPRSPTALPVACRHFRDEPGLFPVRRRRIRRKELLLARIAGPEGVGAMFPDRPETEAVQGRRAVLLERIPVLVGGVAFVILEPVLRKNFIPGAHAGVALDFRQDRRRGDALRERVAM